MFGIDKNSGEVKVVKSIQADMVGFYRLVIGVQDNGLPPHTVFSNIAIDVTEVNGYSL